MTEDCVDVLTICVAIGLIGQSKSYAMLRPELSSSSPLVMNQSYVANSTIAFNCSLYFDPGMLSEDLSDYLRLSLMSPITDLHSNPNGTLVPSLNSNEPFVEFFRAFDSTLEFDFGISRQNRSASEIWLSGYIGNYIGNCLSFLNEFLRRVEIERETYGTTTKLLVKWKRVAAMLGGLTAFQVLFGLLVLLYCRLNLEILDDVSTFSFLFTDFPFASEEERRHEGAVHEGKFVKEGNGVLWVFVAGAETLPR